MHLRDQQRDVVHEAPRPLLARLERADQRVAAASGVSTRMAIGRVVTAADLAALEADSEMQPRGTDRQAVLAPGDGLGQLRDMNVIEVRADGHLN